nr:zinc finger, CCHC-type [Tanacetum cinerariifolium]
MIQLSLDEELAQKLHAEELANKTARQEHERYNLEKALELQKQLDQRKEDVDKGGYKQSCFKGMKYEDIRPIFERVWDQIHTFVPKDSEIKKEVIKRSGFNLQQESSKKQKLDEKTEEKFEAQADTDQEIEEMKLYMKIVPKEAVNDEMDSIMRNNTWVLTDLPPGCKPLSCKWIFKRKLKVDGTIKKFKARLVIYGFKQNLGIYYFDTYALVARISTIRLLISMAYIYNLQMDVKIAFLNGELEKEVGLTKEFLSSRFSMKDMGKADVILSIRINHESNGVAISQSYYIEKFLKKFNYSDCTPVSTPLDTCEKLMPNRGLAVSQLEYSRVIDCLMNTKDNSSTSGWVFLLGGGVISWASKKQTFIIGSTMEFEFVALTAAGKEAEWLKNLLLEIPLWVQTYGTHIYQL